MAHQVCIRQIREDEALQAIKAARNFASLWHDSAIQAGLDMTNDISEALDRLSHEDLFHLRDEAQSSASSNRSSCSGSTRSGPSPMVRGMATLPSPTTLAAT